MASLPYAGQIQLHGIRISTQTRVHDTHADAVETFAFFMADDSSAADDDSIAKSSLFVVVAVKIDGTDACCLICCCCCLGLEK